MEPRLDPENFEEISLSSNDAFGVKSASLSKTEGCLSSMDERMVLFAIPSEPLRLTDTLEPLE